MARESPVGRWAVYEHPDKSKIEIVTVYCVQAHSVETLRRRWSAS